METKRRACSRPVASALIVVTALAVLTAGATTLLGLPPRAYVKPERRDAALPPAPGPAETDPTAGSAAYRQPAKPAAAGTARGGRVESPKDPDRTPPAAIVSENLRLTTSPGSELLTPADPASDGGVAGFGCGAVDITQSTDPNAVAAGVSVACFDSGNQCTVENDFARSFDLSVGPTAGLAHQVQCVTYGIELVGDTTGAGSPVTINLFIDPNGGAPNVLDLVPLAGGSITEMVPDGTALAVRTVDFSANNVLVPVDATLVVTVESPDLCSGVGAGNRHFNGANSAGQSGPSYIRAPGCGLPDFTSLAAIGFPNQHMVLTVGLDPASVFPRTVYQDTVHGGCVSGSTCITFDADEGPDGGTITFPAVPSDALPIFGYLYFQYLTIADCATDPVADFAGATVNGVNINTLPFVEIDCLNADACFGQNATHFYRVDVSSLFNECDLNVASFELRNFGTGNSTASDWVEGATLMVAYCSESSPSTEIILIEHPQVFGLVSAGPEAIPVITYSWSGFNADGASATLVLGVGNGQNFTGSSPGDELVQFQTTTTPLSQLGDGSGTDGYFDGGLCSPGIGNGGLYDNTVIDVSALVNAGDTTATFSITGQFDCLDSNAAFLCVTTADTPTPCTPGACAGACCDITTRTCTDAVAAEDCALPLQFTQETLCADLPAPCECEAIIDADGIVSAGHGAPGAQEVFAGAALLDFPSPGNPATGLDWFDNDHDGQWSLGFNGDDLHSEDPATCFGAVRDGNHDLGFDCKVLDINGDLADGQGVDCDLELNAPFTPPHSVPNGGCPSSINKIRYYDANGSGTYDMGEDIVLDGNDNGIYDCVACLTEADCPADPGKCIDSYCELGASKGCANPVACAPLTGCTGNPECSCFTRPDGSGDCGHNIPCATHGACPGGDTDCPAGTKCFVNTCCGFPVCLPNCPTAPPGTDPYDNVCTTRPGPAGCCTSDADCPDVSKCLDRFCNHADPANQLDNFCDTSSVSGCCTGDADCPPESVECQDSFCNHRDSSDFLDNVCDTAPFPGCCTSDADCPPDSVKCVDSFCNRGDPADLLDNFCDTRPFLGCCVTDGDCPADPNECVDSFCNHADPSDVSDNFCDARELPGCKVTADQKGSLLVYPKIELKWACTAATPPVCTLKQDTILTINNDYPDDVHVQWYFINGDPPLAAVRSPAPPFAVLERSHRGWNWVDCQNELTESEPTYIAMSVGLPMGCQPFTVLDPGTPPGRPDPDAPAGHRMLRGYAIAFAVDNEGREICWDHLYGSATLVDYSLPEAWEYGAYAFQTVPQSKELCECPGTCGTYTECGKGCNCARTSVGSGICAQVELCASVVACPNGQSDCPAGTTCIVDTCCDGKPNICVYECGVLRATASPGSESGLTFTGRPLSEVQAVASQVAEGGLIACRPGEPLNCSPGALHLDGSEYDLCFDKLLLDFFSVGSTALSRPSLGTTVMLDTDLTLLPVSADLRQDPEGRGPITTKAKFDIWNENEDFLSGTTRCITCWDQALLSTYEPPNNFLFANMVQTHKGKARIDGQESEVCENCTFVRVCSDAPPFTCEFIEVCELDSQNACLVGVAAKILSYSGAVSGTGLAGNNVVGQGKEAARILYDIREGPDPLGATRSGSMPSPVDMDLNKEEPLVPREALEQSPALPARKP